MIPFIHLPEDMYSSVEPKDRFEMIERANRGLMEKDPMVEACVDNLMKLTDGLGYGGVGGKFSCYEYCQWWKEKELKKDGE